MPPAAFGRLCVETPARFARRVHSRQPPSGGCVLKQIVINYAGQKNIQPPSGGCVLKPPSSMRCGIFPAPAAFGRLCVETRRAGARPESPHPAAFGRLCVETRRTHRPAALWLQPPSGGCVLKQPVGAAELHILDPAAFGRLCVETVSELLDFGLPDQPPSGGCVLKRCTALCIVPARRSRLRAAVC